MGSRGPTKQPFHYSIHNQAFIARMIAGYHGAAQAKLDQHEVKTGEKVFNWPLDKALKSAARRYQKFCGNTSKYAPHQGLRERARRALADG